MTLAVQDGLGVPRQISTSVNPQDGGVVGSTCVTDPTTGNKSSVMPAGAAIVTMDGGVKSTWHLFLPSNTPAATPTDVLTITGSSTRTIRIKQIRLSGLATTAGQFVWSLIRRSAANTGGTSTAKTPLLHDTADTAVTAAVALYTANPASLGTTVGTVAGGRLFHNLATAQNGTLVFDFTRNCEKALVLRGTTDILAINGAGAALPAGATLDIEIVADEDAS